MSGIKNGITNGVTNGLKSSITNGIYDKNNGIFESVGKVLSVFDGIVKVIGLPNAFMNEIVYFESGAKGVVMLIEMNTTYVVLIDEFFEVHEGEVVRNSGSICFGPSGMGVIGRVLNGVGEPIDGKGPLNNVEFKSIHANAPGIMDRKSVSRPFYTGMLAIDSCISIGKGQRELLIGDRQTGKTSLCMNMIMNQKKNDEPTYCIYVAIGQKMSSIAEIVHNLTASGAMDYTVVISANASSSSIEQFLSPYLSCLIGEYFRDNGHDALIIYDDLTKHAIAYREISLLLKRPPGREAYPGDIFYVHSRLLERAGQMSSNHGGGSLTAIPIVQTQEGDISKYIPTNVISITDGQIFLSHKKLLSGVRPPIDIPLSVSRVGSSAQEDLIKKLSGGLKSKIAQYEELKDFIKFSSSVDDATQNFLNNGEILESIFQQDESMSFVEMFLMLFCYKHGIFKYIFDKTQGNARGFDRSIYMNFVKEFLECDEKSLESRTKSANCDFVNDLLDNLDKNNLLRDISSVAGSASSSELDTSSTSSNEVSAKVQLEKMLNEFAREFLK